MAVTQTGSNGNTNLAVQYDVESVVLTGNGNGTFQGPRATLLGGGTGAPVSADLNSDGLTDVLSVDAAGNPIAALSQGNGAFSIASRTPGTGQLLVTGDFNGDGKLDLVLPYGMTILGTPQPLSGVLFFAGNGDGTFAAPTSLPIPYTNIGFAADLNNDQKLDILGGGYVYLGNGDGTFTQVSSGTPGPILAVGDLNGDGKPDIAAISNNTLNLYAGNGDGTFQATPFYIASSYSTVSGPALVAIGDVNGDGHPDFSLQYSSLFGLGYNIEVHLGDGHGNFTLGNIYALPYTLTGDKGVANFTRLNNQAPAG